MRFLNRTSKPEHPWQRVELSLYRRCRQGNPEAIRTLLYRLGDYWYTVALMACDDREQADAVLSESWTTLLERLRAWHMGGKLDWHGERILRQKLLTQGDQSSVQRAFDQARQIDTDALISVPEKLEESLLADADEAAERIRSAAVGRTKTLRAAAWGVGIAVALTVTLTAWNILVTSRVGNMELVWECLQKRVVQRDLDGAMRDAMAQISATGSVGGHEAETLGKAGLILEEIANAQKQASARMMRYLSERSRSDDLAHRVREIAEGFPSQSKAELMRAALILEEVQSW